MVDNSKQLDKSWKWATVAGFLVTIFTIVMSAGNMTARVADQEQRISRLENQREQDHDAIMEIRGDVKSLLKQSNEENHAE